MNKKEKIQKVITEWFLNDEINVDTFIRLSEKLDNLSKAPIGTALATIAKAKKFKFWQLTKKIANLKDLFAKADPAGKLKIAKQIKNLQRVRTAAYVGGGAAAVGTGVGAARS